MGLSHYNAGNFLMKCSIPRIIVLNLLHRAFLSYTGWRDMINFFFLCQLQVLGASNDDSDYIYL